MKYLYRLAGLLLLLGVVQLLHGCTPASRLAQAPPRARKTYHQAQRRNARARKHTSPSFLPWN